jgi:hypothetical protein
MGRTARRFDGTEYGERIVRRKEVVVHCTGSGRVVARFGFDMPENLSACAYQGIQLTGDGRVCAIANGNVVTLWDTRAGTIIRLYGYADGSQLYLTQDGRRIAVLGHASQCANRVRQQQNKIQLFEIATDGDYASGRVLSFDGHITAFAMSGDGDTLVVAKEPRQRSSATCSTETVVVITRALASAEGATSTRHAFQHTVPEGVTHTRHAFQHTARQIQIAGNRYMVVATLDYICVLLLRPLTLDMRHYLHWKAVQLSDDGRWLVVHGAVHYARPSMYFINLETLRRRQDLCPAKEQK